MFPTPTASLCELLCLAPHVDAATDELDVLEPQAEQLSSPEAGETGDSL